MCVRNRSASAREARCVCGERPCSQTSTSGSSPAALPCPVIATGWSAAEPSIEEGIDGDSRPAEQRQRDLLAGHISKGTTVGCRDFHLAPIRIDDPEFLCPVLQA